jgi:hypothetical protein
MSDLKSQNIPVNQCQVKASELWKNLSSEEKNRWRQLADVASSCLIQSKETSKSSDSNDEGAEPVISQKISAYNLFMKTQMSDLKAQNIPVNQCMVKASELWKNLSLEEKNRWRQLADA